MTYENKSQRQFRVDATVFATLEKDTAEYASRMVAAIELAQQFGYSLSATKGMFRVTDHTSGYFNVWNFSLTYTESSQDDLESLEFRLSKEQEKREENARKAAIKTAALAKLTPEEKELLWLSLKEI